MIFFQHQSNEFVIITLINIEWEMKHNPHKNTLTPHHIPKPTTHLDQLHHLEPTSGPLTPSEQNYIIASVVGRIQVQRLFLLMLLKCNRMLKIELREQMETSLSAQVTQNTTTQK